MNQLRMPAEHGAWGILLVPLVCSAVVAGSWNAALVLSMVSILCLFLLRGSMEAHGSLRAFLLPVHLVLATAAGVPGLVLLLYYRRLALVWVGIAAAGLFFLQGALLRSHRRGPHGDKRSLAGELTGVALLTLVAPAVWIAGRGSLDTRGLTVWILNLLFFLGGVLYVKYRVRGVLTTVSSRICRNAWTLPGRCFSIICCWPCSWPA